MRAERMLHRGRLLAEARMSEVVTFYRVTGEMTDPETLETVETTEDVHTAVARLKYRTLNVSDRDSGTQLVAAQSPEVHVPARDTTGIRTDDMMRVDSSIDPLLAGRVFRVAGRPEAGQTTAHRFPLEEIS